jgi:hypothetical protein
MRRLRRSLAVTVAGALCVLGTSGLAQGSDRAAPKTVHVTFNAIGRDSSQVPVGNGVVARSLAPGAPAMYRSSLGGVLSVPPGKYLLAAELEGDTLVARVVTVRKAGTVTLDGRSAVPIVLGLDNGAQDQVNYADLCYLNGGSGGAMISLGQGVTNGQPALYAVPFAYKGLALGYAGTWTDSQGTVYLTSGYASNGIPAQPDFSFHAADLTRLTLQVKAGEAAGSQSSWAATENGCPPAAFWGPGPIAVPSQTTLYVSAGQWWLRSWPSDGSGQSERQATVNLSASQDYVQTFGSAVVAPGIGVVPYYGPGRGRLTLWLGPGLFSDPNRGFACCADGTFRLSSGRKVIRSLSFTNETGNDFGASLPRPGWYTVTVDASRSVPPLGVSAAILTPRMTLAWRFRATKNDLKLTNSAIPGTDSTFVPAGLDINNDAAAGAVTPLQMSVWRGRSGRAYRIKTVRLQVSVNGGATWQTVALAVHGRDWLARIADPASGFVSLRSTVTDVRGNSTVETIYQAYGIS